MTSGLTATLFCLASTSAFASKALPAQPRSPVGTFIVSVNPTIDPALADRYAEQALRAAHDANIDPCLLLAIVSVESHWKADAISRHGAIGLGQLKPSTAESVKANPFSPLENLQGTSRYLRLLLDRFKGGPGGTSAIAAYNAGPGAVSRNGGRAPNPAAESYVGKVVARLNQVRRAVGSHIFSLADTRLATVDLPEATENSAVTKLAAVIPRKAPARSAHQRNKVRARELEFWNIPDQTVSFRQFLSKSPQTAQPHALPASPPATAADFVPPSLVTHNVGPVARGAFLVQLRRVEP